MQKEERIETLIEPVLGAMGYELVRVQLSGESSATLQVMTERTDRAAMTVDDCSKISREISAILDVDDPIDGSYALEVSSPGIDRPLVKLADFERFAGFDARIDLNKDMSGQRRFRGRLEGVAGDLVELQNGDQRYRLRFDEIRRAKLLLTDELLAATAVSEE